MHEYSQAAESIDWKRLQYSVPLDDHLRDRIHHSPIQRMRIAPINLAAEPRGSCVSESSVIT